MKVERLGVKLQIMSFIGNFFDTCHHLSPVSLMFCILRCSLSCLKTSLDFLFFRTKLFLMTNVFQLIMLCIYRV